MNATTKFYASFFLVLALLVAGAYYAGYRAGIGAAVAKHHVRVVPATP